MRKQILIGIFVAGMWGLLIFFSQWLVTLMWPMPRAEAHMWSTRSLYILIGFTMIVLGFLMLFGVIPITSSIDGATQSII